jgi:hypothetical protein
MPVTGQVTGSIDVSSAPIRVAPEPVPSVAVAMPAPVQPHAAASPAVLPPSPIPVPHLGPAPHSEPNLRVPTPVAAPKKRKPKLAVWVAIGAASLLILGSAGLVAVGTTTSAESASDGLHVSASMSRLGEAGAFPTVVPVEEVLAAPVAEPSDLEAAALDGEEAEEKDEADAEEDAEGVEPVAELATPRPARRWRRARQVAEPEPLEDTPEPEAEPAPRPTPLPKPAPPSASALLDQARAALRRGDHEAALRLARRSHASSPSEEAMTIAAQAACRAGDTESAKNAIKQLPLLQRAKVRRECRRDGSPIGL